MPGDVVLGDGHGLLFIPPQLAEEVVKAAETTQIRDEWMKQKFDTRQYKSSDIYGRPRDPALAKELEEYIKKRQGNPK
jgi:4-hydroxy-4-methyl-2-oxoglutarate aldolase